MQINFLNFKIEEEHTNLTIREFLLLFNVSKRTIYQQELFNLIRVNNSHAKLNYRLKEGDKLAFKLAPFDRVIEPFEGSIDVVYEDEDIIIVNKPVKMLIHEDGNTTDTLTNRVSYYFHQKGYDYPVLPAHRIDYETSGLVLYAKHFIALSFFSKQFEEQTIKKMYIAICDNYFTELDGVITHKIGKDRHSNKRIVLDSGREARTEYYVIDQFENKSKLEIYISGGRTHQIRVHLSHIGHPIVGDPLYGKTKHQRMLLHFKKIEFIHPRNLKNTSFEIEEQFNFKKV